MPLLRLDSRLLAQALGNVLHNSTVHAPPGSPIEVHAALKQVQLGQGEVELTVHDHGPGLTPEAARQVFDKFYRAPDAPAGGTGLGLAIARGLVRALQGDITAGNHPEGGALFTVRLPVQIHQTPS